MCSVDGAVWRSSISKNIRTFLSKINLTTPTQSLDCILLPVRERRVECDSVGAAGGGGLGDALLQHPEWQGAQNTICFVSDRVCVVPGIAGGHLHPLLVVPDLSHSSVELDIQSLTESNWNTAVTIPHCQVGPSKGKPIILIYKTDLHI